MKTFRETEERVADSLRRVKTAAALKLYDMGVADIKEDGSLDAPWFDEFWEKIANNILNAVNEEAELRFSEYFSEYCAKYCPDRRRKHREHDLPPMLLYLISFLIGFFFPLLLR